MVRLLISSWVLLSLFLSRTTAYDTYDIPTDFPETSDTIEIMTSSPPQIDPSTPKPPNWPGAHPLDVDNYPVAPPELKLEQVHVYVRHGKYEPRLRPQVES